MKCIASMNYTFSVIFKNICWHSILFHTHSNMYIWAQILHKDIVVTIFCVYRANSYFDYPIFNGRSRPVQIIGHSRKYALGDREFCRRLRVPALLNGSLVIIRLKYCMSVCVFIIVYRVTLMLDGSISFPFYLFYCLFQSSLFLF